MKKNFEWIWKLILLWVVYISTLFILLLFFNEKIFKIVASGLLALFILFYDRIMVERKYGKSRNNDNNGGNTPGDGDSPGNDTK